MLDKFVDSFFIYLFFYLLSLSFAYLAQGFQRKALFLLCDLTLLLGFSFHLFFFSQKWIKEGITPSRTLGELLDSTSLALTFLYFLSKIFISNVEIQFFLNPFIVFFLLFSRMFFYKLPKPKPYFTSLWFPIHIFLLIVGISLTIFAFIYATVFIMQDYSLRKRKMSNSLKLVSIEKSEDLSKKYLIIGYLFLTLGFFSSAIYGISHRGDSSSYHPGLLEFATFSSWVILGISSYGYLKSSIAPKKRVVLLIFGSSFILFIFLGMLWH